MLGVAAVTMMESRGMTAERRASLTVTGGVGATINPYLSTDDMAKAMLTEITLNPVLTSKTAISTVELAGTLGYRRYTGGVGSSLYGSGVLRGSVRRSERLQLSGSAFYRHETNADVVNEVIDSGNSKTIRRSLGGTASAQWRTSEFDIVSPNFSVQTVSYTGDGDLTAYDNLSGGIGYSRRLNPFTSVGIRGGGQIYLPRTGSNSTAVFASATVDHKFSSTLNINGGLGIQHISAGEKVSGEARGSGGKIYPAANVNACRRGQWTSVCLTGAISAEPTSRGSLERRISAGISYARRLSEYSNVSLAASYQRSSGNFGTVSDGQDAPLESLYANASFDKRLNKSLTLGTYLTYRRRAGQGTAEGGSAGFNLRWTTGRH